MSIIYSYPVKGTPANDDLILISDSADSNSTKQIKVSSLPGGSSSGVSSFNTLTGAVTISAGANITLTPSGSDIEISASGGSVGVSSFTNANGTYISAATVNTAATGAVTTGVIDLSAIDGTSDTTTRFLSKDNTWDVPSYTAATAAAGSSGQVQYNDGANGFTASAGLVYSTGGSLNTLAVGAQGSVPGVLEVKGADTTVGRLRLYCPDSGAPHYFELMGPDHSGAATYSVQVPEASPGGTEKILSVSTWNSGTSKADLAWVDLPTDTNTNIANANLTLNAARTLDLSTYNFQVNGSNVLRLSNANADPAKVALRVDNNVKVAGQAYIDLDALGNAGTSREIDWNDSNIQSMTLNGNLTISALSNGNPGGCYILVVTQPAGQAYTISWPSTVDWHNNNTAPGTITADRTDVYTFICRTTTSFLGTYAEDFII